MIIGFAGSGNMAAAMARGWGSSEHPPERMLFADKGSGRAEDLAAELGGERVEGLRELAAEADMVVLAVKPAGLEFVAPELTESKLVLSVLGGTSLARLRDALGTPVIRAMPTIAAELHTGVICHAPLGDAERERGPEALAHLGRLGRLVEVEEALLDPATAVMGCTPAYFALFAEAIADAGAAEGLDPELSLDLVAETLRSTAALLRLHPPQELRKAVASPGGSTEAGLEALADASFHEALAGAVEASLARMRG
jgi:pyrroline-5-carboxylate reductase